MTQPSFTQFVTVVLLLTPGRVHPQAVPSAVADVRAARIAQNAALASRQMDSVASFWVEDVVITASLGRVLRGREAYRQALIQDSAMVYVRTPSRVEAASPWPAAWEEGEWVGRQGRSGPVVIQGHYAAQWRRVGTRWLIRSEVFVALACSGEPCQRPLVSP
jgi:ketosteroid isomerase-like protein